MFTIKTLTRDDLHLLTDVAEDVFDNPVDEAFARERDELIWLEHGEERTYSTRFAVLDGQADIAAAEARIAAIAAQPEDDYPEPTGRWEQIEGRG